MDSYYWPYLLILAVAVTVGAGYAGVDYLCERLSRRRKAKRATRSTAHVLAEAQSVATAEAERLADEAAQLHLAFRHKVDSAIAEAERLLQVARGDDGEEVEA
jgi:hypothetical protein